MGTMTVYTLLLYPPQEADIELLKMSCQMASLVLERQRLHEQLIHRAYHDPLTGLGNRRLGKKGLGTKIIEESKHCRAVVKAADVHGKIRPRSSDEHMEAVLAWKYDNFHRHGSSVSRLFVDDCNSWGERPNRSYLIRIPERMNNTLNRSK